MSDAEERRASADGEPSSGRRLGRHKRRLPTRIYDWLDEQSEGGGPLPIGLGMMMVMGVWYLGTSIVHREIGLGVVSLALVGLPAPWLWRRIRIRLEAHGTNRRSRTKPS